MNGWRLLLLLSALAALAPALVWGQKGAAAPAPLLRPPRVISWSAAAGRGDYTEAEGALRLALRASIPALAAPEADVRLVHRHRGLATEVRRYRQTWRGWPIADAEVVVTLDRAGRLVLGLERCVSVTAAPEPARIVAPALDPSWRLDRRDTLWLAEAGELRLIVEFDLHHPALGAWRLRADAATGAVLSTTDRATYADTTGRARVFRPDPLTTAGVAYGATADYRHNGGATNPSLEAQRRLVTLRGLTFSAGQFVLEGPHARVRDVMAPVSAIATTPDGDFSADRSQPRFTDAMAYFYIDSLQRYVQQLGFANLRGAEGIRVDPRGDLADQSYFVGGSDPFIALGVGGVPDAEDADVIVHEYAHALSFWAAPGSNSGLERQGYDEGWADYLAASFSAGLNPFGTNQVFNWDGHNEFWPGRIATATTIYDPARVPMQNIYELGTIWCGALMAARARLGQPVVDRVHFEALGLSIAGMTLRQAARHLVIADSLLSGATNRPVWDSLLCARGLLTVGCPPPVPEPTEVSLDAWALPDGRTLRLVVQGPTGTAADWVLYDLMGRRVASGRVARGEHDLALLPSAAPGLYLLRLSAPTLAIQRRIPLLR